MIRRLILDSMTKQTFLPLFNQLCPIELNQMKRKREGPKFKKERIVCLHSSFDSLDAGSISLQVTSFIQQVSPFEDEGKFFKKKKSLKGKVSLSL